MCGEHMSVMTVMIGFAGSSPHVRGTQKAEIGLDGLQGIIPACAGNTESGK